MEPEAVRSHYVDPMVELRKSKGLTAPMAEAQLEDTVVLGTMMLAMNEVDRLVSGAVHTTANTIRPAFQLVKTKPDAGGLVSSVFFMLLPEQVLYTVTVQLTRTRMLSNLQTLQFKVLTLRKRLVLSLAWQ